MAEELEEGIENALNLVVLTTDRSGNMKKELKQTIYETVRTLRNLFVKLKNNCDVKSSKICELQFEVSKVKTELQRVKRDKAEKGHGEPSVIASQGPAGSRLHGAPSVISRQEPAGQRALEGSQSGGSGRKLYSEGLANRTYTKKYKLTVKSNEHL